MCVIYVLHLYVTYDSTHIFLRREREMVHTYVCQKEWERHTYVYDAGKDEKG